MATHSSILAWKIPWAEEPGGLQDMGSQRGGYHWAHTDTHTQGGEGGRERKIYNWVFLGGIANINDQFRSVTQSCPTLWPHGLKRTRLPCSSSTPGVYSNSCPLSQWCHPTISSSVMPFSSHLQSFPASGSFQMSHLFPSGGQSTGVSASASVLPMLGLISL